MESVMRKKQADMDSSESLSKSEREGTEGINAMYEKYKQYQALLAKYNVGGGAGGDDEDSGSVTISKSQ